MKALLLSKGANVVLAPQAVALHVTLHGTSLDVSALLLGPNGKVRTDDDLVFYNHPSQDGVTLAGHTVTVNLPGVPAGIDTVAVVASADPAHPGTVFTTAPVLSVSQRDGTSLSFTPPDFAARETVVVLAEIYRRGDGWKVRAVGQGYASGLAGLAADYGVDVEPEPSAQGPGPLAQGPGPSARPEVGLAHVELRAPALLTAARQAEQTLIRTGVEGRRAAVYLILDHDWSTQELYESSAVQAFAERVLALSASLGGDGALPVIVSHGDEPFRGEIGLDDYPGGIGRLSAQVGWGWGNVGAAMGAAVSHYQESGATDPALVVVQVGDDPWDKTEFRALLQNTASLGVFWLFVGFGRGKLAFYKNLNASTSATFTNAAFCEVSKAPGSVPGEKFYAGLVDAFAAWMKRLR